MVCQYCRYEGWKGDRCPQCGVSAVAPYGWGVPRYPYYIPLPKKKLSNGKIALITAGGIAAGMLLLLAVWLLVQDIVPKTLPGLRSPYVEMTWQGQREGPSDKTTGGRAPR